MVKKLSFSTILGLAFGVLFVGYGVFFYEAPVFVLGTNCGVGHIDNGNGTCTATFYPDADPGTTSFDGTVANVELAGATWASLHDGSVGTKSVGNGDGSVDPVIRADGITNKWDQTQRGVFLFDSSSLPDGATISSATFEFVLTGILDNAFTSSLALVTSTPASNTAVAATVEDFNAFGTVDQATRVTLASLTNDGSTYNIMTLNATGLSNINKTGITKFGVRISQDVDNVEPTWVAGARSLLQIASADEVLAGDKRPKLVVTYTPQSPPPSIIEINPSSDSEAGGTTVTITGFDFVDKPTVSFGATIVNSADVTFVNSTQLTVIVPAGVGTVDVTVENPDAQQDTLAGAFVYIPPPSVSANNVSGYAWSENIGWVSFNCIDGGTCGSVDYGVNIREGNYFEGYAWSENIGWVGFNAGQISSPIFIPAPASAGLDDMTTFGFSTAASDVYYKVEIDGAGTPNTFKWSNKVPGGGFVLQDTEVAITGSAQPLGSLFTNVVFGSTTGHTVGDYWTFGASGPPPSQYNYSNQGFFAQYQTGSNEVRGWARALSGLDDPDDGFDGWLKTKNYQTKNHPSDGGASYEVTIDKSTGEMHGWAWGGDVIGWLSFNCAEGGSSGENICGTSNYKVVVEPTFFGSPPVAAISCNPANCEGFTSGGLVLNNDSTDPDGPGDIVESQWTGIPPSVTCPPGPALCNYTTQVVPAGSYTVSLRVEDKDGNFDTATTTPELIKIKQDIIANFDCSLDGLSWQSCDTLSIAKDEAVQFRSLSTPSEGAAIPSSGYSWTFEDGNPPSSSSQNATVSFQSSGTKQVSLQVQDSASRTDTKQVSVVIAAPFPEFKEVSPF